MTPRSSRTSTLETDNLPFPPAVCRGNSHRFLNARRRHAVVYKGFRPRAHEEDCMLKANSPHKQEVVGKHFTQLLFFSFFFQSPWGVQCLSEENSFNGGV